MTPPPVAVLSPPTRPIALPPCATACTPDGCKAVSEVARHRHPPPRRVPPALRNRALALTQEPLIFVDCFMTRPDAHVFIRLSSPLAPLALPPRIPVFRWLTSSELPLAYPAIFNCDDASLNRRRSGYLKLKFDVVFGDGALSLAPRPPAWLMCFNPNSFWWSLCDAFPGPRNASPPAKPVCLVGFSPCRCRSFFPFSHPHG